MQAKATPEAESEAELATPSEVNDPALSDAVGVCRALCVFVSVK